MTTPVPPMTDIPPFPALADRAAGTYNSKAYAFGAHMAETFNDELVAVATNVLSNATEAAASAVTVATDKAIVAGYKVDAEAAVAAAGQAANAPKWVSGTNYADEYAVLSPIDRRTYRRKGVGAGVTDPSADPTNWAALAPLPTITRKPRNANTILGAADAASLIDVTSGTFPQTFDPAASLGNGWYVWIRNAGTGDITLDPNGAETIDGLTSFIMYPNEVRFVQCDGTELRSFVITPFAKTWTSSGTFAKPPGYSYFGGFIIGGGSSGEKGGAGAIGRGGGGGGCYPFTLAASYFSSTETLTVGAGGVGSAVQGGTSSIGSILISSLRIDWYNGGGVLANNTAIGAFGFEGASGQSGLVNAIYGGGAASSAPNANSGNSVFGAAAGGSMAADGTIYLPGTSKFAGNGGSASSASSGADGAAPGGGGGATQTGTKSGDGARGEVRIFGVV